MRCGTATTIRTSSSRCSTRSAARTCGCWARTPAADRERLGRHRERGPESYDLIVRMSAGHDRFHLAQAERALAAVPQAGSQTTGWPGLGTGRAADMVATAGALIGSLTVRPIRAGATTGATASTTQNRAGQIVRPEDPPCQRRTRGRGVVLEQPRSSISRSGPSARSLATADSRMAATLSPWSAATWRPLGSYRYARPPVIPAPKLAPTGPRTTTMPPVMYSQPCGPMPSTTASAPLLRTAKRIPARPTRCSRPPVAPYRHGVAGDRLAGGSAARSGSGDDRDRAAGQALADVVVGLADERQLDARTGERAERLAGGAAQLEPDRAAELAALEGTGQAGTERAIGRGERAARRP